MIFCYISCGYYITAGRNSRLHDRCCSQSGACRGGFPGVSGNPLKFPANENLKNRNTLIEHSNNLAIKAVKGPDCALPPLKLWLHPSRLVLHIAIPTTAEFRVEFLRWWIIESALL